MEAVDVYIDHESYLNEIYEKSFEINSQIISCTKFSIKNSHFSILTPHIATSPKIASEIVSEKSNELKIVSIKKGQKRKIPLNQGEIDAIHYHEKIYKSILDAFNRFLQHYMVKKSEIPICNPKVSNISKVFQDDCISKDIELITKIQHKNCQGICVLKNPALDALIKTGNIIRNCQPFSLVFSYNSQSFLCPPNSTFLLSDISQFHLLIYDCEVNGKYDCIVVDPPWENKSVKRGRKYEWLTFDQIISLPVPDVSSKRCLVLIWVTNKQKIMKFVKETLLKSWGMQYLCDWHWVKVTKSGKPVFPFNSLHKKPYETLVLGCNDGFLKHWNLHNIGKSRKVFFSVPSIVHSHKPPLEVPLSKMFNSFGFAPRYLELFARSLVPGWTSWGNEVLKMQNIDFFNKQTI